jgi:hypothetical protein
MSPTPSESRSKGPMGAKMMVRETKCCKCESSRECEHSVQHDGREMTKWNATSDSVQTCVIKARVRIGKPTRIQNT